MIKNDLMDSAKNQREALQRYEHKKMEVDIQLGLVQKTQEENEQTSRQITLFIHLCKLVWAVYQCLF